MRQNKTTPQIRKSIRILFATIIGGLILVPHCLIAVASNLAAGQSGELKKAKQVDQEFTRLYNLGEIDKALPLAQRALSIREKALGPDHADTASSLHNLAMVYLSKGDFAKAEALFERALAIYQKVLGPDHLHIATSLKNLARVYMSRGEYAKAEPVLQRSLSIHEKALGPNHLSVAEAYNNLAGLYELKGEYAKGEPLLRRALTIHEKALGSDHISVAGDLNTLAVLYDHKGDYDKAEQLCQRALAIYEKALGPDHTSVAVELTNLALLYVNKGDYAKAESLHRRALSINEKALGPDDPDVAASLNNLARLYDLKGEYTKGEPLLQRALTIDQKALGPDHPYVANDLNAMALLYEDKGDRAKAEPLYQRALAIDEKALGSNHPSVALALNQLALFYANKSDYGKAIELRRRATDISETNIRLNLATGSERQKSLYLESLLGETDQVYGLHLRAAPDDPAAIRLALTTLLRRKGRALDAMTEGIGTLRKHFAPEQQALLDQMIAVRGRLSTLILTGPAQKTVQSYQSEVRALEEQAERLEDEVSRQSAEYRAQSQPVSIEDVQAAIPAGASLVEFISYRPWSQQKKSFVESRYAAYILASHGEAKAIDLGDADTINAAVRALRDVLRPAASKPLSDIQRDLKPKARALDELVMRPVRKLIGDQRRLLISPDGTLNLIPFAVLVDEKNEYLIKKYSISYVTSGRDLLRLQMKVPSKQPAAVIADPDFDRLPLDQPASRNGRLSQRVNSDDDRIVERTNDAPGPKIGLLEFQPLERLISTADEAAALQETLPRATILTGKAATKAAVKGLSSPAILHIATHGFFLDDQLFVPGSRGLFVRQPERELSHLSSAIPLENPLLRSGLFFAGANTRGVGGNDDGILTALEASGLDLWGTKLVVLSACETGLGDVRNGEGVYGLRRAFVLAGSQTQVMSLWSVSDQGTSELMIDYYKRLKAGEGRSEALRNAQLQMLAAPNRQHPYYWAAFIQSGEWANLEGKR